MFEEDPDDPPTMSGYLNYKERIASRDPDVVHEYCTAWRESLFEQKPAIVHYHHALSGEEYLKDLGADNPMARARMTGLILKEFEESGKAGSRDELLFRAASGAVRRLAQEAVDKREAVVLKSTPILDRFVALRDWKQDRTSERLAEATRKKARGL
jgi:hypothetical protein